MKTLAIFIYLFFALLICNAQNSNLKRYPFKSGIVVYKYSGKTTGKSILYFDNYGQKEARFENVETKILGMIQKTNQVTILNGDTQIEYDLTTKQGTKTKSIINLSTSENSNFDDVEAYSENMMKSMGYKKVGKEKILGKNCDIWAGTGKTWTWKGLNLKTEVNLMGQFLIEAISIKTNVSIPKSKFEVPKNIILQEVNDSENAYENTPSKSQKNSSKDVKKALKTLENIFGN